MHHGYVEARSSGKRHKPELDHIRIHAHPEGTPDNPAWIVVHNHDGADHETEYPFSDHGEMMQHIHDHTHPDVQVEEEGE